MRNIGGVGYAYVYLNQCLHHYSHKIDIQFYTKLVELDSRIGIRASEQLYWCLNSTTRSDIIEVLIFVLNEYFRII